MIYDTNLLISVVRKGLLVSTRLVLPIVVVGELKAFSLKADWGIQKANRIDYLFTHYPIADVTMPIATVYAQVDAFSQGKLKSHSLGDSARNIGKNDIWMLLQPYT